VAPSPGPGGADCLFGAHFQLILQKVEGSRAVALIGIDGIPVSRLGADAPDLDLVTAMLADAAGRLRRASEEIDTGALDEVLISMGRHAFVLHSVTNDYLLLAVLERGGSLGRARFELRRTARLIHDDLV
jgi:predicted regulator of Ras-like GTPase activity (Roadblock/LC7/MglB family)